MNLIENNSAKMNEIIFKDRNKNYGAYMMRSEYGESIYKSLLLLGGLVAILFFAVYYVNKTSIDKMIDGPLLLDDPKIETKDYVIEVTNTQLDQPTQKVDAAAAPIGSAPPIIVDEPIVTTQSVNIDNPNGGKGDPNSFGTSLTSTLSSVSPSVGAVDGTDSKTKIDVIFVVAEEMPEFAGGVAGLMSYIGNNVRYPEMAKAIGKEGTVYVSFIVNEIGVVENVKIARGIGYGCDEEVVRVISKMPTWAKVGKNNGKPVKVRFNMPVKFALR